MQVRYANSNDPAVPRLPFTIYLPHVDGNVHSHMLTHGRIPVKDDRAHMGVMISRLREALEPFARLQLPARTEGNAAFYSILHKHILDARSILQEASHD